MKDKFVRAFNASDWEFIVHTHVSVGFYKTFNTRLRKEILDYSPFNLTKMNTKNLTEGKRTMYENEFSEFLIKRLSNSGGSMQLQHITGHMSQLRNEVRNTVGTSISDLKQFLREHSNLFCIDNNLVSLASSSMGTTASGYDSDNSSVGSHMSIPAYIEKGKGVVVKLFPTYGFIKSKEPVKSEVYFNSHCFGDSQLDLTSFLYIGAKVYFEAERSKRPGCKYTGKKVWRADNSNPQENKIIQKSRKNRETGLYDPLTLNGEGIIQKVFPNLGFIAVNGDDSNTVFFYKSRVLNFDNIVDLTKIFSKGDAVEFNAHRSTKQEAKARWEATKVWKKSGKLEQSSKDSHSNKASSSKKPVSSKMNKAKEMIKDQSGKICPRAHGTVIKFGDNQLVDGDSAMYYVCGTQVTEISWEFTEGDAVKFDAVKIKSAPGWKAVLVWSGDRPNVVLPTCLGDYSEFTDEEENEEIASSGHISKSNSSLSVSSASSLKSMSVKSGSNNSNRRQPRDFKREKSSFLSSTTANKKIKDNKSKTHYISENNLNESSYSVNFQYLSEEENLSSNKFDSADSNWKDESVGYVDDDDDDDVESRYSSGYYASNNEPADDIQHNVTRIPEKKNVSKWSEEENSEDEEINSSVYEISKSDVENHTDSSDSNKLKQTAASIQKFQDVAGEVSKVYSKFAEVKIPKLQKNISFSWNDFYIKGKSVEEQELDDLKSVLKIGDIIYFNYFIIIDDSGQSWQKITLAWKGPKPRNVVEKTPKDFIETSALSVTINDEMDADQEQKDEIPSRKFLSSYTDEVPGQNDSVSKINSCIEDVKSLISLPDSKVKNIETKMLRDFKNLRNTVCQKLKKDVLFGDPKVDLRSVSEEIMCLVIKNYDAIKSDVNSYNGQVERTSNICSKCRGKCSSSFSDKKVTKTDCDSQTIITGEIIAQSVFPEC